MVYTILKEIIPNPSCFRIHHHKAHLTRHSMWASCQSLVKCYWAICNSYTLRFKRTRHIKYKLESILLMTGVASGAGTANPSKAPKFTSGF
jgi:hypothetical protein